jgi:hypothetical protein
MDIVEIDLFGRTFVLKRTSHLSTEGDQVWYRWIFEEKGFQIALCRSVMTGNYNAYANFDEEEPTIRRFNVWGIESSDPEESIRKLQESILSVGMLLSNVLRGQEIES